jgi:transmembrane sensor
MSTGGEEDDKAGAEAAYWSLALEEEPDNAELRARFEAWLAASPANCAAWSDTSQLYDLLGSPGYAAHRKRREARRGASVRPLPHRWSSRRAALAVGALAAAACLALFALPGVILRLEADHVTATAEMRSLMLDDGSSVALAPDSAVEIVPGPGRTVRLLKGEALFQVKRDPERPFRVLANTVETTVLGTEFDVRLHEDGAVVAVREGIVRVARTAAQVSERLEAGDWVSVTAAGVVARGARPTKEVAAWQSGRIIARDRSIADIADEVRRSFRGFIVVTNETLGSQRVTGVYNLSDPVAALRAAAAVHGGAVRQISPWLLVVSGG